MIKSVVDKWAWLIDNWDMDARRETKRLVDLYRPGDPVQIYLADWRSGRVVAHQPPAVWVELSDGTRWFVTNGRHIRPETHES